MSTSATFAAYGLASTITDTTGSATLRGPAGVAITRKSMPLAIVDYDIAVTFAGSGDAVTVDTSDGTATGQVTGLAATGTINFSGLPSVDQTVTVRGLVYTFKTTAAAADEITIGVDAAATALNTAAAITARDALVTAAESGDTVNIAAASTGEAGNAYTLAQAADNTSVSGATLSGGVDAVTVTGDGVDALGVTLPAMAAVHGILILCTTGSLTAALGTVLKDTVTPSGGLQTWSVPGRADLIGNLVLTSTSAGTACRIVIRASE